MNGLQHPDTNFSVAILRFATSVQLLGELETSAPNLRLVINGEILSYYADDIIHQK